MIVEVRPAAEPDLAAFVAIRNAVTPDWPASVEEIAWATATYPGGIRLIATLDGRAVGAANAGRIYMYPPQHELWWGEITVLPEARRRGAGRALLAGLSASARKAGKTGFHVPCSDARRDGIAFLEHRGFTEYERARAVRLEISPDVTVPLDLPDGISLVALADRPQLVRGVHEVALEAIGDIPGDGEAMTVGDFDEFRARDVERPGIRADGFMVALAGEDVVGYASVQVEGGRPDVGIHDMTAVRPAWRGRGIATALKAATIGWARAAGLAALETGNDVENAPMRAVNARLGYRPLPDIVFMRGPLVEEPAEPTG